MTEIRETRLPGIGTKFSLDTRRDENVCVIVHTNGMREIYHLADDEDDEPYRIALTDEEARQVGALLGGVIYRPQLVQDLEVALGDLVVEWLDVPADSPLVGLTVETCRIRRTTGATIIAIMRQEGAQAMPRPTEVIAANDVLVVLGKPADFSIIRGLIVNGPPE